MMKEILFIQYPKCSTCRKAEKWLKDNNVKYKSRNIVEDNPRKEELDAWITKSGMEMKRFFNTSGKIYRERNLKDVLTDASRDEQLEILASDGMVVKRPIIVAENIVLVGFNEEEWANNLK